MLRIRHWLVLGWFIVVASGGIGANILGERNPIINKQAANILVDDLIDNPARWSDPTYQNRISTQLTALGADIAVMNQAGMAIYQSNPSLGGEAVQELILIQNGQRIGRISLYIAPRLLTVHIASMILFSILMQLGMLAMLSLLLGRTMLKPLESMGRAAQQIASGHLDFNLPPSRVREVAEVTAAFHAMGDALRISLTKQAEVEQERRFFVSAIAHDLRTPLFALRGYLEGLEKGLAATPEKAARYIAVCQEKANALEGLVADLFAYTRMEYLEQAPRLEPMDFSRLVSQTVDDFRWQANANHISVHVENVCAPCEVKGDWPLLVRALGNLMDNALRYTPSGGDVWITLSHDTQIVRFVVADSGPGIADLDLPHLFTPLYRAETSRSRQTGGAGLGLTIAQRILRAHGGDLVAANRAGGGAEFVGSLHYTGSGRVVNFK